MTGALLTDPATTTDFLRASIPAVARSGVAVTSISAGRVVLLMPIEGNANHVGTMYAGSLFAIAELPGGLLPWTVLPAGRVVPIAKEAAVRFRRPASTDVTVTAELDPQAIRDLARTAEETGRADFTLQLSVRDSSDAEVMTAQTTTALRLLPH